jgi:hypothetical protein
MNTAFCIVMTMLAVTFFFSTLYAFATLRRDRRSAGQRIAFYNGRLSAHNLAIDELGRALWSFRNIFDHVGAYLPMDGRLNDLLFRVANQLPAYAQQLPHMLEPLPDHVAPEQRVSVTPRLSRELEDGSTIDVLVKSINDPVFNRLWEARTPAALTEMLRHGLFLALGYGHSVAAWSPEGVNLQLTEKDPGYPNWGCVKLEVLDRHKDLWTRWRALKTGS